MIGNNKAAAALRTARQPLVTARHNQTWWADLHNPHPTLTAPLLAANLSTASVIHRVPGNTDNTDFFTSAG